LTLANLCTVKFQKLNLYLSPQRFARYLNASGNQKSKAVRVYKANLKIAQSFHPLLGAMEVTLRNCINNTLINHFSDPDWIINQKNGFMIDPSLTYINRRTNKKVVNHFLKLSVEKSERRFLSMGIIPTSGKIIADQSLSFWTDLFEVHHYRLLMGKPIQIFNHLPSGNGRKEVCDNLNRIRQFRNRINHNEPICFNGGILDFTYSEGIYCAIVEILTWIDPDFIRWIKDIDAVRTKINYAKRI